MTRFILAALLATIAAPALAVPYTPADPSVINARDIGDREGGFQIGELSESERGGLGKSSSRRAADANDNMDS